MYKLFTMQQATTLLPVVDEKLREMQGAIKDIMVLREQLEGASGLELQHMAEEIKFLMGVVHADKLELDRMGVHLQDVESGRVDFPSRLGAEVIYLCWEQGEDAITHYHRLNQGANARVPLPEGVAEAPGTPRASA